ncbi:uncharacterized protein LOC131238023 [Magnolia sinica]|uniref:uncharacterized protein LOC131238023 n=1 Tax=Magnolia sinica TaxID=86752 RepID=UPI00265A67D5|nr:uncharacterized protein LOC131238023 [Magnolia sinica]
MTRGTQPQTEFNQIAGTPVMPGALEINSAGDFSSLFRELPNRGRVVRVREVTENTPASHDPRNADLSNMVPWHQMGISSEHQSLPIPPPHPIIQGMMGHHISALPPQWQIQANNSAGVDGQDTQGDITVNCSSAPTIPLPGMAGYDVWSMLPAHLKDLSLSCTMKPTNRQNTDEMNWQPDDPSDHGHSFAGPALLNIVRAPSSIYDPIYQGTTLCADPHLKAYTGSAFYSYGTNGPYPYQSSTSYGHLGNLISPDYVFKVFLADHLHPLLLKG